MHFHPELGPPPTVGLEFEVTAFKEGKDYIAVANNMFERGMTRRTYTRERHDWHHSCPDCKSIGKDIFFPVQWKLERDSSLPIDGCEFISSPFPTAEMFVTSAVDALTTITKDARWTNKRSRQRGDRLAEAGFHVHTYSSGINLNGDGNFQRLMQTLYYFLPEFFALSQSTTVTRSLEYRLPSNDVHNHHSWIAFVHEVGQRGILGPANRVEWRLWEAPVDDISYLEAAVYLSAAMLQLAYNDDVLEDMEKIGILSAWDQKNLSLDAILDQTSARKLRFLRKVALNNTHLIEDERGTVVVENFFKRVL